MSEGPQIADARERTGYVVGFLVAPTTDEVLLVRKNRPAWQAGRLNGIGGHMEPGEVPRAAMIREFLEETGLLVDEAWRLMVTMTFPMATVWFYRAHASPAFLAGAQSMTDEPIVMRRIGSVIGARIDEIIPNLRWMLPLAAYQADTYEPLHVRATVAESVNPGDRCAQCGEPFTERACGPTHAIIAAERAS